MTSSVSHNTSESTNSSAADTPVTMGLPVGKQLKVYLKVVGMGSFCTILLIFCVFSIFWGSLYKMPARKLPGWIVDFDGDLIGQSVVQGLTSSTSKISWTVVPATQFSNAQAVADEVYDEKTWFAITINPGASPRLRTSLASPNASYDGSEAISVFAVEARNENAFRSIIRPTVQGLLDGISRGITLKLAQQAASNANITVLLQNSPQTVTQPVSYRLINIVPFDQTVASAVTFVGLIYQLILSFFIVMICLNAREISGLGKSLSPLKLIVLRLGSAFVAYFFISLFYSLLSVAFQLDMTRKFGHAGFLIFWMLNYVGMLALGLALEALITLVTPRFIPFFMLTWVIANVSVCVFPLEVMPVVYRYGKGAPFYNVSVAMRTLIFGTKNLVGLSFGVLIAWVAINCITLSFIQIWEGKRNTSESAKTQATHLEPKEKEQTA